MKFKIISDVSPDKLLNVIPHRYRELVRVTDELSNITILLFRSDRNDVVLSRVVRQALTWLGDVAGQRILAIGGCFTIEAQELLEETGIEFYQLSTFPWTDETYTSRLK